MAMHVLNHAALHGAPGPQPGNELATTVAGFQPRLLMKMDPEPACGTRVINVAASPGPVCRLRQVMLCSTRSRQKPYRRSGSGWRCSACSDAPGFEVSHLFELTTAKLCLQIWYTTSGLLDSPGRGILDAWQGVAYLSKLFWLFW